MTEQAYTVFEVKIEQQHVQARSSEDAAAKYFAEHPEVQDVRVLSEAASSEGDWFDLARDLTDSEPFGRDAGHPCDVCGGPAFDGECADPICNEHGHAAPEAGRTGTHPDKMDMPVINERT